ncbi:protein mono-ADP-ribosyltransferase TIPARP-like [Ambystoma mexicanum]|uniref:protein mono-ADP-ribosyltransferase TIPARP-like n=1 Tax=Ambystoma mexicanum TaxID=8296 RepID=UPI0037E85BC7
MASCHERTPTPVPLKEVVSRLRSRTRIRNCVKLLQRRRKTPLIRACHRVLLRERRLRRQRHRALPFCIRYLATVDCTSPGQEDSRKDPQCGLKLSDLVSTGVVTRDTFSDTVEQAFQDAESLAAVAAEDVSKLEEDLTIDHILEVVNQLHYHIHKEEGIEICPNFLLGCCLNGHKCPMHHTILPYHWQLWHMPTESWESVGGDAQEILERLYSDPAKVHIRATYQCIPFVIDLQSKLIWYSSVFNRVRRLSTSANAYTPFHTGYKYYYKEAGDWLECSPVFVQNIEEALRQGAREAHCRTPQYHYVVDLLAGYQQNMVTGTKRQICCRPIFCSPVMLLPQLRTLSGTSSPENSALPGQLSLSASSIDQPYPETWLDVDDMQDFTQVPMSFEDRGYRLIYSFFHKTMPESKYMITSIQRVQNCFLWDKYKRKKAHMSRKLSERERLVNERHLFHGTSHSLIDAICKHNFDPRLSGKHAIIYGQGSYFARKAKYSHRYAPCSPSGQHYVFLSKVLVGKSAPGICSYRRPPALVPEDPASDLFDSCVDSLKDPQIYVIFDNDQCYPYFIIQYEQIKDVLRLD